MTNGAADDLQKARQLVRTLVINYGMSKYNPNYAPVETDGQNIFSEKAASKIDQEVIEIIQEATVKTRLLIETYQEKIRAMAEAVLKK